MRKVRVAPKGMGLNDFVAMEEGLFAAEGIEVEWDMKTFRGTQSSWKGSDYFQRPQDKPYTEGDKSVIQCACVWGSISNAASGMGRFVGDCYGVSPLAIFVRPESRIRPPEGLQDLPISPRPPPASPFNLPFPPPKIPPPQPTNAPTTRARRCGPSPARRASGSSAGSWISTCRKRTPTRWSTARQPLSENSGSGRHP